MGSLRRFHLLASSEALAALNDQSTLNLPGTFEGGPYGADLQSTNRYRDFLPIFPIPVKDQEPGSLTVRVDETQK